MCGYPFIIWVVKRARRKIQLARTTLQNVPNIVALNELSRNEQIAFWLNLYNVSLIGKLAQKSMDRMQDTLYGENSILDEKFITVAGVDLSLNDIQFEIVYKMTEKPDPLLMYGFFQGVIGSPKVRRDAYLGTTVFSQLADNADEFINSNRGTHSRGGVRASWYYDHNQMLFPDFQNDLRTHLEEYMSETMKVKLLATRTIRPILTSFNRADFMSGEKQYGLGGNLNNYEVNNPFKNPYASERIGGELLIELAKKYSKKKTSVTIEDVADGEVREKPKDEDEVDKEQ